MNYRNKYIELREDPAFQGEILEEKKGKVLASTTEGIFYITKKELKKDWIIKKKIRRKK